MTACRFCASPLEVCAADLGMTPLANSFLAADKLTQMEPFLPLAAYVCGTCFLVQLGHFEAPEHIFSDYAYFSSFSDTWLKHAEAYADKMVKRLGLGPQSEVIEIASNDGYLLQYFVKRGIPVLGIEPAANVAKVAVEKGVPSEVAFFGRALAEDLCKRGHKPDLMAGNNVLAHVPNINDFVAGIKILLAPKGVLTIEVPHLLNLIEQSQFDTIYHEHFYYFSLMAARAVLAHHGLRVFDVEALPTHGGSLRLFATHAERTDAPEAPAVAALLRRETAAGLDKLETYTAFAKQIVETKLSVLSFFIEAKRAGKLVLGYGAPAKGNTLLNYCGVGPELLPCTVDRSPHKQGLHLPGTHIPVLAVEEIARRRPDYLFILPWNLEREIVEQMAEIRSWGGKFVTPIPRIKVI
ncbi:MAG: class I SAM-dependent methyltransferase [Alphaproteobacteria bacterium]|nr:class I SAM-dependent methyltransferase [Alphaproteobacteria bacterium]